MIKKRLSLLLIILFCAVLNPSTESFTPDAELTTLPRQLIRSPFIRDSAAIQSPFGIQSFGKYTYDLSAYEGKQLLKIAAFFSTIEAVSAGVSCVKTCAKKNISDINFLLAGLFAFRVVRSLSHLYLTYQAVNRFNPNEERENPDTEESKKEAASAQYEVAWRVAGTVADSPLFERIRQESYNFSSQPRGGLERLKPLLPVIYPLASGLIGAAFDIVKIVQTFRNEPLFIDFKDTENIALECGSLLAHAYASGNIIEILPSSVKKYVLTKGLAATYYPSLIIAMGLLARSIITTHGKEYTKYREFEKNLWNIRATLGFQKKETLTSLDEFNTALNATFHPIEDDKKISFNRADDAPKCMHCNNPITANDEFLVNKNNLKKALHVRGDANGCPRYCFIKKLASGCSGTNGLTNNEDWVLQKPTTDQTITTDNCTNFIELIKKTEKFKSEYSKEITKEQIEAAIMASKEGISYQGLSPQIKRDLSADPNCPLCIDACSDNTEPFLISHTGKSSYHIPCLAQLFLTAKKNGKTPEDPMTRDKLLPVWENWLLCIKEPAATTPAGTRPASPDRK